jgi:hypothetical protein
MIHGRRSLILTDIDLQKLFKSKFAPHQSTVLASMQTPIDANAQTYFEDVYEPAHIVPHQETISALITIWNKNGMKDLTKLEPELRKMATKLKATESANQQISDFIYAMY